MNYRDSNITLEDATADDIVKILKALGLTKPIEQAYSNYVLEGAVIPQVLIEKMDSELRLGRKIQAIKEVRGGLTVPGGGYPSLKGAKDFVDRYTDEKGIEIRAFA